tara:strand:- start:32847 stop:33056 length:210 start_codon:yes stop_codon:yes gene_type:complete
MKHLLLLSLIILVGCNGTPEEQAERTELEARFQMTRTRLGHSVYRVENQEVICYYEYDGGMDCEFKAEK